MTVFLRAHDFKSFACHIISYHLVQNLLEVHVQLSWSSRYHHVKFYATVS